jgi:hypothetical protein
MNAFNPIATLQMLKARGVPHTQAEAIADGLTEARIGLATKPELEAEISAARDDFKAEMKLLRADFRADLNAMALRLFLANTGILGVATTILGFLISLHQTGGAR